MNLTAPNPANTLFVLQTARYAQLKNVSDMRAAMIADRVPGVTADEDMTVTLSTMLGVLSHNIRCILGTGEYAGNPIPADDIAAALQELGQ